MLRNFCNESKCILPHKLDEAISSPLARFLGTNYAPLDSECGRSRPFVAEITIDRRLDDQISRLCFSWDRLIHLREKHTTLLSIFRQLRFCNKCKSILPYEPNEEEVCSFAQCLGTTYAPLDSGSVRGRHLIAKHLCQSRERMIRLQDEYTTLLSRFRQLPVEVIGLFFTIYVDAFGRRQEIRTGKSYMFITGGGLSPELTANWPCHWPLLPFVDTGDSSHYRCRPSGPISISS
jgi:hypothetical protein